MSAAQYKRRRGTSPTLVVLLLFVAVVGTIGTLYAMGEIQLSFLSAKPTEEPQKKPDTRGMVPVPIAGRTIPPYTRIELTHLMDPRTPGKLAERRLPPGAVSENIIDDVGAIVGRVLKTEIKAGYMFSESLFFPKGTRPGMTAGIPPGKRALRLSAEDVLGFHGLNIGDRFDICATSPIEGNLADELDIDGPMRDEIKMQAKNLGKQAVVRFIVQNGQIVMPIASRSEQFTDTAGIMSGARQKSKEVEEIVIAIDPDEVAPLMESIDVGDTVRCIPRSGHPDDPRDSITPDRRPAIPFADGSEGNADPAGRTRGAQSQGLLDTIRRVEVIEGDGGKQKRGIQYVPDRGSD